MIICGARLGARNQSRVAACPPARQEEDRLGLVAAAESLCATKSCRPTRSGSICGDGDATRSVPLVCENNSLDLRVTSEKCPPQVAGNEATSSLCRCPTKAFRNDFPSKQFSTTSSFLFSILNSTLETELGAATRCGRKSGQRPRRLAEQLCAVQPTGGPP